MGKTKRKFSSQMVEFSKTFKKSLDNISQIMPIGFSDNEYIDTFKKVYPHLVQRVNKEYSFWKKKNDVLIRLKKKSRYNFPNVENFIYSKSIHIIGKYRYNHRQGDVLSDSERAELKQKLIIEGQLALAKDINRTKQKLTLTQEVTHNHLHGFISKYFNIRSSTVEELDEKSIIIAEVAKYKNKVSIEFLQKVTSKEVNFDLKQQAMKSLQNMDEKAVLTPKKKGNKKSTASIPVGIKDSPKDLLNRISNNIVEANKTFDVFISHSYKNTSEIKELFKALNSMNYHIYVDWVNDRTSLERELTDENTARVILKRLNNSKILIYAHSEESITSQWTPWEIGYFHGLGKKIFIYNPDNIEVPVFLKIYSVITFNDDKLNEISEYL